MLVLSVPDRDAIPLMTEPIRLQNGKDKYELACRIDLAGNADPVHICEIHNGYPHPVKIDLFDFGLRFPGNQDKCRLESKAHTTLEIGRASLEQLREGQRELAFTHSIGIDDALKLIEVKFSFLRSSPLPPLVELETLATNQFLDQQKEPLVFLKGSARLDPSSELCSPPPNLTMVIQLSPASRVFAPALVFKSDGDKVWQRCSASADGTLIHVDLGSAFATHTVQFAVDGRRAQTIPEGDAIPELAGSITGAADGAVGGAFQFNSKFAWSEIAELEFRIAGRSKEIRLVPDDGDGAQPTVRLQEFSVRYTRLMQDVLPLDTALRIRNGRFANASVTLKTSFPVQGKSEPGRPLETKLSRGSARVELTFSPKQIMSDGSAACFDLRVEIRVVCAGPAAPKYKPVTVVLPCRVSRRPQGPLVSLDVGTSSIAAWAAAHAGAPLQALQLGSMLEKYDRQHDEIQSGGSLIPSHVGICQNGNVQFHTRVQGFPFTLGDIRMTGVGPAATRRRLVFLDRSYDLSLPFSPRSEFHRSLASIVTEPKLVLASASATAPSLTALASDKDSDVQSFASDYIDEVMTLYVQRAVYALGAPSVSDGNWDDPLLVLTIPSGAGPKVRERYRTAGRRSVARLKYGALASGNKLAGDLTGNVELIPESLAATRFAIDYLADRKPDDTRLILTLDIGQGTYDCTAVLAFLQNGRPSRWEVLSHFGIAVGGFELDRALRTRIVNILRELSLPNPNPDVAALLAESQINPPDRIPSGISSLVSQDDDGTCLRAVEIESRFRLAKIALADQMRAATKPGDTYAWRSGVPLAFEIGCESRDTLGQMANNRRELSCSLFNGAARLIIPAHIPERQAVLHLWPSAFSGSHPLDRTDFGPDRILDHLGRRIPEVALGAAAKAFLQQRQTTEPKVIEVVVTGRAALWPPLYARIAETVASFRSSDLKAEMARNFPFEASDMKRAVAEGAACLARESLALETPRCPIALLTDYDPNSPRMKAGLIYLAANENRKRIKFTQFCCVVTAIPGLTIDEMRDWIRLGDRGAFSTTHHQLDASMAIGPDGSAELEISCAEQDDGRIRFEVFTTSGQSIQHFFLAPPESAYR
jgi:hypothetical protein